MRLTAPSSALTAWPSPSVIESGSAKKERYRTNGPSMVSRGPGTPGRLSGRRSPPRAAHGPGPSGDGDHGTVQRPVDDPVAAGGHPRAVCAAGRHARLADGAP